MSPHPIFITGVVLNVCQPTSNGAESEMMVMTNDSELGTNYYYGPGCNNFKEYSQYPVPVVDGATGCIPVEGEEGAGSLKGFIANSVEAMIAKYNSLNAVITLNYESAGCGGQFPTIDMTILEPCRESTDDNGSPTGTYYTETLTSTGVDLFSFDNSLCDDEPSYLGSATYADMLFNICVDSDDPTDNLQYMFLTTHFLIQSHTLNPTRAPTLVPTINPAMKPSRQPTQLPSLVPSQSPSLKLSFLPSLQPSFKPTFFPTLRPSLKPTKTPTILPTILTPVPSSRSPTTAPSEMTGISAYYVRLKYTSDNELITERVYYNNDQFRPTVSPTQKPTCNQEEEGYDDE